MMMKYEEYKKIMRAADSKGLSALIKFAMKNPGAHMQYMKRYAKEGKGG